MSQEGASLCTKEEFLAQFPAVMDVILKDLEKEDMVGLGLVPLPAKGVFWIKELLEKTMVGGKLSRGIFVVRTRQICTWEREKRQLTEKEFAEAAAVGWAVEALQASFLVADDIIDKSLFRRGDPCWYKRENPLCKGEEIGLWGVNDALIVESFIYVLLQHFFSSSPSLLLQLTTTFQRVAYQTQMGQFLDLSSQPSSTSLDFSLFVMEVYSPIVIFKTSFYSFYLPVAVGLILSGLGQGEALHEARDILLPMGEYFQIQDDFLDCYGTVEQIGKVGRDIQERKCSWLIVKAVALANEEQKQKLEKHYGIDNEEDVKRVKEVFVELKLVDVFEAYEEESHKKLEGLINQATHVPKELYTTFLNHIYKRQK